jgi:hypothetical protein
MLERVGHRRAIDKLQVCVRGDLLAAEGVLELADPDLRLIYELVVDIGIYKAFFIVGSICPRVKLQVVGQVF